MTTNFTPAPTTFAGINEADAWPMAPLIERERVHFKCPYATLDLAELRDLAGPTARVSLDDNSGLYRIDTLAGEGDALRERLVEWLNGKGVEVKQMRVKYNLLRRDLNDLPSAFLNELCIVHQRRMAYKYATQNSFLVLTYGREDVVQQIGEWVLEAATVYKAESGVPFAAFVIQCIDRWRNNPERSRWGRSGTELEHRHNKVIDSFRERHGRTPNMAEAADALGITPEEYNEDAKRVAEIKQARFAHNIQDVAEPSLPADFEDTVSRRSDRSLLARTLVESSKTACGKKETPNILGLLATYETNWIGTSKSTLAQKFHTTTRTATGHMERLRATLSEHSAVADLSTSSR